MQKKYRRMLIMLVYILVVSSTIAYSALTSTLQLNAEAKLRTISDIRVTGISLSSANGGTLQYESSYDVNTITSGFVLPTTDSSITYKVTVTNNGTIDQTIYDILTQSSNNSGLYYEISGYNVRDVIGFKTVVEFYITYKTTTPSNDVINVVNRFNFKKVYHVTFETNGGTNISDAVKYEGVDLSLTPYSSTKTGYTLSGWTDEQAGTTVKYNTNGTYTLDRDLILYAIWEGNPNTSYSVNHYVHDLGTNTYTLDSTDNLTGTTDSTLTLASLKKTIPGFTYVDGYLTGGTTKPTSGAVTTTTILADGSRVINLYYRRNYLYVQYHVNGGQLAEQHGSHFGIANSLVTSTGNTTPNKFWVGVYGSKVNAVTNANTYAQGTAGLDNYNNPNYLNLEKTGYTGKSGQEWNTNASGTGTSYSQAATTYDANTFGGADLSTGDQVVTLYVNWVPVDYEIMYDLQGGTLATSNPATYNIETNTFTLNNPTLTGYTFTGWTGSNGNTPQTIVTIPVGSTGDKAYIAHWQANSYTVTADANGGSIPSTTGWTGTGNTATKSVTYDSPYGTLPTPTRTGYTFLGWNGKNMLDLLSKATKFWNATLNNDGSITSSINDNYYSSFNANYLIDYVKNNKGSTITFSMNETISNREMTIVVYGTRTSGGVYQEKNSIDRFVSLTIADDFETVTSLELRFNRLGSKFTGTATRSEFQIEEGTEATPYEPYYVTSDVNVTQAKNHTLTAKWNPITYTIAYDLQGGSVATANPISYNIESNAITLNNPTMTGYTFIGWTGSNGNVPQTTVTIPAGSTGDKAYIANWQANTYTVTADANGGSIPSTTGWTGTGNTATKSVTYNSQYGTLPTPTRDGYIFKGWNGKNILLTTKQSYTSNANTQITHEIGDRPVYMEAGRTYYISYNIDNNSSSNTRSTPIIKLNGTNYYENAAVNNNLVAGRKIWEFTPTVSGDATIYYWLHTSDVDVTVSNFMISTTNNTVYEPYYVTSSTNVTQASNHTLTAIWDAPTFVAGRTFNAIIKYLSGDTDASYATHNTSITSFRKYSGIPTTSTLNNARIVSTKDSYTPIYAWFDNGTIYYYSESTYIYFNADSTDMFQYLQNMTSADISDIKTNKVESMQGMFNYCSSLTSIDLSNFDTSNVTNMYATFGNCTSITSLDLSNFDTSKVTNMDSMFAYNQKLTSLDLSSFDMSKVTSTNTMLYNMTSLKSLKTPKVYPTDSNVKITLPKLMVDSSDNEYTELNSSSPTETMLYTPATFLPGTEFNAKIKQLAANEDATYQTADTNITSILRTNALPSGFTPTDDNIVSTSDSNTPIYAWFSNGTLYYYTDAVNFYMNNSATYMFYNLNNVTSIDIADINTSKTTSMYGLFHSCYKLSMLDVSNFNTSNVTTARSIFAYNRSLTSLDVSSFDLSSVNDMTYIFTGMTELKQLKTPKAYPTDSSVKITLPKLMVDSSDNEYTELNSSSPTETWLYTPATFLPGTEFNAKIKQLAGNENATYNTTDTNITSIVRSDTLGITPTDDNIVSTSDSNTPIYAWYDNGTIYYYTEEENPYMNTNASFMFYYLLNVTSIDISDVKTINTNNMYSMFYNCRSLETIDVSNFNTSKVTNMSQMFAVNRALTTLDLSSFNTSNVTEMAAMFRYCNSLKELDLSKFDMTKVTNANLMITDLPVLESLKTPNTYPSEATIQIPKTLYDPSGNAWSVLDSSAPTETWLHKMICKRATTLHTETCSQTSDSLYCSGAGYKVGGSKNTSTITYGSLGTNATTLNNGDAFTCDVNGDGTFNELTERFYYVGDYYNTTTKQFEKDTGVLIYYNDVSAGVPNNTVISAQPYDSSGENWHGPVTAITQLPTTNQWTNVGLKNNTRAILNRSNTNTTGGGTLPSDFSYSGYSARLLTVQEINHSLNRPLTDYQYRLDEIAPYYFENTLYSSASLKMRTWLETAEVNSISVDTLMVSQYTEYVNGIYYGVVNSSNYGVRPAIEVNKNFLNKKVNAYLITYDTNGGSENTTQTVTVGDSLGTLSVPTKEGYTFNGWYTEASGGEEVTTATVPTATTTYYAHWTPIDYNITYDLDGGEVGTANPTTYNPDSNSITLNNPTKTGYTFAGWSGGKNLFNKDATPYYQNSWINESGNRYNEQYYSVYKIPIDENKEYTITHTHTVVNPCYAIFDENDTLLIAEKYSSRKTITFTSPANSKYILVSVITDPTFTPHYDKDIFQLEEGSTATSYEPYVSNETTLTIPSGSVGNRKYTANWTANSYTVTADANGGSIPSTNGWTGTGNTATKSVTYDSQYGTLPTPTRDGYIFRGWNGKNLFNEQKILLSIDESVYENNYYVFRPIYGDRAYGRITSTINSNVGNKQMNINFKANTQYTLSYEGYTDYIEEIDKYETFFIGFFYTDGTKSTSSIYSSDVQRKVLTSQAGKTVSRIAMSYGRGHAGAMVHIKYIQLEEGTVATTHEPYYVTSSTNVTQDKNHTLKAIWEMDTYEIQYDLQGGTLANSNPATYNVETNTFTLNNPTLTGQTFIGWTGSNGNTPEVNVTIPVGSYGDKAYVANFSPIYEPETRIRSLNTIGTSIADDDPDSNLRFIGANPNNYVSFNGQKWRIIGVFDGKLKIIGDSIGNYSWDTSRNTVNKGYGINQWGPSGTYTGADLMKLLNPGYSSNTDLKCNNTYSDGNCGTNDDSDYTTGLVNNSLWWNAGSGYCYNSGNYQTTTCDFTTTGLQSNTARNMIDTETWYLGSNSSGNIWDGRLTASYLYNMERSNNTGKQCSSGDECTDDVTRTTTWQGKVGLVYPSDYAYATSGGTTYNRISCLSYAVGYVSESNIPSWQNSTYTDCKNNDWLLNTTMWTWTLTPRADTSYSRNTFNIVQDGYIRDTDAMRAESIRPVVYLKSSIKLTSGDGSYNSPFNLIDTE